jgi:MATE family multidrug resistance protein
MHSALREAVTLIRYAFPLVVTQLGMMALGVVDIWMVGRLGREELAAVALGDLWVSGTLIVGVGVLLGIDPVVSQAHGARDGARAAVATQQGIVLALIITLPLSVLWAFAGDVLGALGGEGVPVEAAHRYVVVQIFSIAPHLVFMVLRQYLVGRAILRPSVWVVVVANLVNVFANWVLIFGHLGFPALGIEGAGIATGLTRWAMLAILVAWIMGFRLHADAWVPFGRQAFDLRGMARVLVLGVPVGVQIGLEVWAFVLAGFLASWLGPLELASHTIVLRLASLSFMVPLGISFASVTRIGNLIGAGKRQEAQRSAWIALALGGGVMLVSAATFTLLSEWLPAQFSSDARVIALAASILPVAAAFQLFDGAQVVGCGILRGMGNTLPAAVFNLIAYYVLALPVGAWLTFSLEIGLAGIWWGLCLGLGAVSVLLVGWIWRSGPARGRA